LRDWLVGVFVSAVLAMLASPAAAEIELPRPDPKLPLQVSAQSASHWKQGAYDVWLLGGDCVLKQGKSTARGQQAVLWVEPGEKDAPTKIIAYLEQDVSCQFFGDEDKPPLLNLSDKSWFGRFYTEASLQFDLPAPTGEPANKPPIFQRGMAQLDPSWPNPVRPAQFQRPVDPRAEREAAAPLQLQPTPGTQRVNPAQYVQEPLDPVVPPTQLPPGARRIRVFPRSDVPVQAQWFPSPGGQQWMATITSGVNLIVDGVEGVGTIDVAADRLVIWTAGLQPDLSGQTLQSKDLPLEIYIEGNIVFRQGQRVIYAKRMYYDVRNQIGIVLDSELLTPVPNYAGMLRFKAAVMRQLDANRFVGNDAVVTSSRMGNPRYNLASGEIYFEDQQTPALDPVTGAPLLDPATGEPVVERERMLYSNNNLLELFGVPVFYWPTMATNLEDPSYYVNSVAFKSDNLFGFQTRVDLDAYQLLGVRNPPRDTDWELSLDYLSKRGPAAGTEFTYDSLNFLGIPASGFGAVNAWGVHDTGLDNLGGIRNHYTFPSPWRGRIFAFHRQQLPNNYTLTAQLGLISDRNFLEQYFEREWDQWRDENTFIRLKQIYDNRSWAISTNPRLNHFFTQSQWLPKVEHNWLGEALFGNRLTWYEHSEVGYARLRVAEPPEQPSQLALYSVRPYFANVDGARVYTRQEIDLPLNVGAARVVPYALGELAHWGEALDGNDAQRGYIKAGARASLPFWSVNPTIENQLFDVHGLAHKVVFESDLSWSDASLPMTALPLYDELDDNAQQEFRRRFFFTTFNQTYPGGQIPFKFDPRSFALRRGLGGNVTSPVMEIADNLTAMRLGMKHRWQTKRGHPSNRRIIDLVTFDTNATLFDAEDNFGQNIGLIDYDFRWHVGDRLTFLSNGLFDVFPNGFKRVSVGGFLTRPPRGNLYLGLHTLRGPVSSTVISFNYNYRMSPKWISSFGSTVDLGSTGNIGQNLWLTRIGESALVRVGFNYDANKDVFGLAFLIEPRFLPVTQTGRAVGAQIPPAGAFGLE
jgi:hypothetical protein